MLAKHISFFNIRLNNQGTDISDPNLICASTRFAQVNRNYNTHVKFRLIKTTTNKNKPREFLKDILRKIDNF